MAKNWGPKIKKARPYNTAIKQDLVATIIENRTIKAVTIKLTVQIKVSIKKVFCLQKSSKLVKIITYHTITNKKFYFFIFI